MTTLLIPVLLLACNKDETPTPGDSTAVSDDSDVNNADSGEVVEDCMTVPEEISPKDEKSGVYWRDTLSVTFTEPVDDASFVLRRVIADTGDQEVHEPALIESWNETHQIVELTPQGYLHATTNYALDITVCEQTYTSTFSTGEFGDGLTIDASELEGRAYVVDLGAVDFTEPAGFGSFMALYLDIPILIGVQEVSPDETKMQILGAQGRLKNDGTYTQKYTETIDDVKWYVATWPFEDVSFADPYFSGSAALINLSYSGVSIPVYDFHIEGTFSSDATSFGGGKIWGLADTRNMAPLFDEADDPNYVCELVGTAGVACEPCPADDENYCLYLKGEDITAEWLDYITLLEQEAVEYE